MKKDVKTGSNMLRQNLKTIRGWLEEQSSTAARWAASESRSIERGRYLTKSLSMFASAPQKRRSSMWRASSNHIQPRRSHRGEQYSHICSHLFVLSCLLYNEMCCALNHAFQLWPVASCVVLTLVFCVEQTKLANETAVSLAKFHCCQTLTSIHTARHTSRSYLFCRCLLALRDSASPPVEYTRCNIEICSNQVPDRSPGGQNPYLPIFVKVQLQGLDILLKAEYAHCPYEVVAVDSFPLLSLAFVTCPAHHCPSK